MLISGGSACVAYVESYWSTKMDQLVGFSGWDLGLICQHHWRHRAFDDLFLWFNPVDVCVALLLYILINGHYRPLLIHTQSVLKTVVDNWTVDNHL